MPADWNPSKQVAELQRDIQRLPDADPRATALLEALKQVWAAAPTNPALHGKSVRIAGYVVPIDTARDGVEKFLLVPYFGACIHSPPPPSNQIIHVALQRPARGLRAMDAVWVYGTLTASRSDSAMGASHYAIEAAAIEPHGAGR